MEWNVTFLKLNKYLTFYRISLVQTETFRFSKGELAFSVKRNKWSFEVQGQSLVSVEKQRKYLTLQV